MTDEQKNTALAKYRALRERHLQICDAARNIVDRHRHALEPLHAARIRLDQLCANRGRTATYLTSDEAEELIRAQEQVLAKMQAEADRLRAEHQSLQSRASEAGALVTRCRDHLRGLGIPSAELQ